MIIGSYNFNIYIVYIPTSFYYNNTMAKKMGMAMTSKEVRLEDYTHSPAHYAVAAGDYARLARLVSGLPRLADPSLVRTESESIAQEQVADQISAALDRRDVPGRDTPLHLAVKLDDLRAARALAGAGADVSLQNEAGWNALQEAVCARRGQIAVALLRHHHAAAWGKWRRRLPRLLAALRRMPDFYMEMSFHFESSLLPFARHFAPSDTYRIWKRDADLRADTSLAGFDGLKVHRAEQSFLFLGDGDAARRLPPGTLLVLNRDERRVFDAFENAGAPLSPEDEATFAAQSSVYRPGVDVTKAELVGRTNWRKQERTETVGEWKAKVYELHNVVFTFRTRKPSPFSPAKAGSGGVELVFGDSSDDEDGFLVAENSDFISFEAPPKRRNSCVERGDLEKKRGWGSANAPSSARHSFHGQRSMMARRPPAAWPAPPPCKESEYVKSLRPSVWLTEQFPLKTEELLPLLDILANKVKAVRRLRELLTTKLPPATFPVKVAIPVVPTVRVIVTFTKFVNMEATEQFYTPMSSPGQLKDADHLSSSSHWNINGNGGRWKNGVSSAWNEVDPFAIPVDYTWSSAADEKSQKMKKSKSTRRGK